MLFSAVLLPLLATLAAAQFGALPPTLCASGISCAAGSLCPEAFPDPAGNLAQTIATRLRDFSVEGKISAIDPVARVYAVNGLVFETSLIAGGILNVAKLPSDTPTTLSQLTAADLGSTMIANGHVTKLASGCVAVQATDITWQIAENVITGQLTAVDLATGRFFINNAPVTVNTDPRLPRYVTDINGNVINTPGNVPTATPTAAALTADITPLAGTIGTVITATGYFDAVAGVLRAAITNTAVPVPIPAGGVGYSIKKYQFSAGKLRLDFDLVCGTAAQCNNAVIAGRLGTTTTNACEQPICTLAGCTVPRPALAILVAGQWTITYSIRLTMAAPPRSLCVSDATSGATVIVTGP